MYMKFLRLEIYCSSVLESRTNKQDMGYVQFKVLCRFGPLGSRFEPKIWRAIGTVNHKIFMKIKFEYEPLKGVFGAILKLIVG
jgi:hypothetical protein